MKIRNYLIVFLIFIFVIIIAMLTIFAASGILKLPFFNSLLIKEPQPAVFLNDNFEENLNEKFVQIKKEFGDQENYADEISLEFTQEEVLGMILIKLSKFSNQIDKPQIIIRKNAIQMWAKVSLADLKRISIFGYFLNDGVWVDIHFLPITTGKQMQFEIKKLKVGSITVPNFMVNYVLQKLFPKYNLALSYEIKGIKSVKLDEGEVFVITTPEIFSAFESEFKK